MCCYVHVLLYLLIVHVAMSAGGMCCYGCCWYMLQRLLLVCVAAALAAAIRADCMGCDVHVYKVPVQLLACSGGWDELCCCVWHVLLCNRA
mgnify:CR=1 FL=1